MTFNVHLLHHLSVSMKNWGPLWAHSAFNFENENGQHVKLVKGVIRCKIHFTSCLNKNVCWKSVYTSIL